MANGNGTLLPPEVVELLIQGLAQAIAAGVQQVDYADRSVKFHSISDLLKAWDWSRANLGLPGGTPIRRGACFSKGLNTGYGGWGALEHQEIPGVDVLFSRGAPCDPTRTTDVDWERAR
jgi:hypothetical protein